MHCVVVVDKRVAAAAGSVLCECLACQLTAATVFAELFTMYMCQTPSRIPRGRSLYILFAQHHMQRCGLRCVPACVCVFAPHQCVLKDASLFAHIHISQGLQVCLGHPPAAAAAGCSNAAACCRSLDPGRLLGVCCKRLIAVYVSLTGRSGRHLLDCKRQAAAAGVACALPHSASRKALPRQVAYMCFVDDWTGWLVRQRWSASESLCVCLVGSATRRVGVCVCVLRSRSRAEPLGSWCCDTYHLFGWCACFGWHCQGAGTMCADTTTGLCFVRLLLQRLVAGLLPLVYSGSGLHSYMSGWTARGGADDALFSKILCTGYISTHCLLRIISNAKLVD